MYINKEEKYEIINILRILCRLHTYGFVRINILVLIFQATTKVDNPEKPGQEVTPIHRIRITLTSRNVRSLEKGELDSKSAISFAKL